MEFLKRTVVGDFKIEDSISLVNLEKNKEDYDFLNSKILGLEEVFKNLPRIVLNARKQELFLNGVMLTFKIEDGIYNIYSENQKYIGIGIVKNKILKRDVVIYQENVI